jgi:hypothetical protein
MRRRQFFWTLGQVGLAAFAAACGVSPNSGSDGGGGGDQAASADDLSASQDQAGAPADLYGTSDMYCDPYSPYNPYMYCGDTRARSIPRSYLAGGRRLRRGALSLFERLTDHRRS